jgi:hypothetical protein
MAINQGITVPIFTTFSDKGIKQAETSISGFEKLASSAVKTLSGYFATSKIIEFAKSSVAAFGAENAAATQLSQTISNMGYSHQATSLTDFITKTSLATGILKSELSPAFDTLLRSSKSAKDAQSAFNLALDISAGTGKDLATVSQALSKAQGGNVTALSKLGTGLTATQIKTKDTATLFKLLSTYFNGDASAAANSYAGTVKRLSAAFTEMKANIGEGIITGLQALSGDHSIANITEQMATLGQTIGDAISGLGILIGDVTKLAGIKFSFSGLLTSIPVLGAWINILSGIGAKAREKVASAPLIPFKQGLAQTQSQAAANKLAADNLKTQAAITAQLNAQTAATKAQTALKLASNTTNMQNIEIQAALQQQTDQDTINRLLLQRAVLTGNADAAKVLSAQVLASNNLVQDLNGNISQINPIKPITDQLNTGLKSANDYLNALIAALNQMNGIHISLPSGAGTATSGAYNAATAAQPYIDNATAALSSALPTMASQNADIGSSAGFAQSVIINIAGSVTSEQDLATLMNNINVNATAQGIQNRLSRINSAALGN